MEINKINTPSWVPHGKAILAYWEGNTKASIGIKMEDGSNDEMPASIYFRTAKEIPELESYALSLCKGKILDIGAGAGAHCLLLQEEGKEVVGLDISSDAVEVMNARGVDETHCNDFLNFKGLQEFDTLLFLMNGIGIAGNLDGLKKHLIHAHHLTTSTAQILLDSSDLKKAGDYVTKGDQYFGIVSYRLTFHEMIGESYQWLYIDPITLNQIATEANWNCQVIYESDDGSYLARLTKE